MNTRPVTVSVVLSAVPAMIAVALVCSSSLSPAAQPEPSAEAQLETRQARQLIQWEKLPAISLADPSSDLLAAFKNESRDICMSVPKNGKLVRFARLSSTQQKALAESVIGLLNAYTQKGPEPILAYMAAKGEKPIPEKVAEIAKVLVQAGALTEEQAGSAEPRTILMEYWKLTQCNAHWKSMVAGGGCVTTWETREMPELESLGITAKALFSNESTHLHIFQPRLPFWKALEAPAEVLMADVQILIEHTERLGNERCPYFLRFWYAQSDEEWHPLQLKQVSTRDSSINVIF